MRLALVLAMVAGAAQAQFIVDGVEVETPSGRIEIVDSADGFSREVHVGGQRFFTQGDYRHVNVVAQRGSLYLVELGAGGNACPAVYAWLHTAPDPRLTEYLGNCSYMTEVLSDAETVTVVMAAANPTDGRVGFVYDGREIVEAPLGQVSAGIGRNPADWIGHGPYEIFADADWRDELVALLGEGGYRQVGNAMERSTGFEQVENWIVADGFNPMDGARAAMVMNLTEGQVIIALRSGRNVNKVWGDDGAGLPEAILARIEFR